MDAMQHWNGRKLMCTPSNTENAFVNCVDGSVSFYEDDYLHHTSCITEAEKYEKTSNKQKPLKKNPQDEWNKMIEKSISSAPESLRSMFT